MILNDLHEYYPFQKDNSITKEVLELKEKFKIECAIETGTWQANTTIWLSLNFKNVHSIEIDEDLYNISMERCEDLLNLKLYLGKSQEILEELLPEIKDKRCFFYLDAHWQEDPLPRELEIISELNIKPIILIHDFYVPNSTFIGDIRWEDIKKYIEDIYGVDGYKKYYNKKPNTNNLSENVGVCFIIPKNN